MASDTENGMDYQAHNGTYAGFNALMKWGTILSFIAAAVVVFIIAS